MVSVWESRLRLAAIATRECLRSEKERHRREPTDVEVVVATLAKAHRDLRGAQVTARQAATMASHGELPRSDVSTGSPLASFVDLGCRIDGGTHETHYREHIGSAEVVIATFDELGASLPGSRFDPAKDKAVLDFAVRQLLQGGVVNNRAIGRAIGLSHTQVAERKEARCARIMGTLRKEFPVLFRQVRSQRRPPGYLYIDEAISCGGRARPQRRKQRPLAFVAGS
jgi:hypothetical protein